MSYNHEAAYKEFITTGAFLVQDIGYDPANPPDERRIDSWHEGVAQVVQTGHEMFQQHFKKKPSVPVSEVQYVLEFMDGKKPDKYLVADVETLLMRIVAGITVSKS